MTGSFIEKRGIFFWVSLVTLVFAACFALMAYSAGQDGNWDFYNYHFYNAFAFFNDRIWWDIQPAQRQTYFNPWLDIPFYWLTQHLGVLIASFAYSMIQSLQAPAVFAISYVFLRSRSIGRQAAIPGAIALATLAALAPLNFLLVGTTTGDNTTASLVLIGMACFVIALSNVSNQRQQSQTTILWCLAGGLMGLSVGLKLTNAPFAIAMVLCALLAPVGFRHKQKILLLVSFSCLGGFLLGYGYWGWFLYDQFQNPLFPHFNHIFQSEYMKPVALSDHAYKAPTLAGKIFYPFLFNIFTGEFYYQRFLDLRIPLVLVACTLALLALLISSKARQRLVESPISATILVFYLVSYALWLHQFSVIRYIVVLEVLSPLALLAAILLISNRKWTVFAIATVALTTVAITSAMAWKLPHVHGPRTAWSDSVFDVEFPRFELDDSMVLVGGGEAMAFIIPSAPESARFIRIDSNLNYVSYKSREERYGNAMGRRIADAIDGHLGNFYIVYSAVEEEYVNLDLAFFDLAQVRESCEPIESKGGPQLLMCRVLKD